MLASYPAPARDVLRWRTERPDRRVLMSPAARSAARCSDVALTESWIRLAASVVDAGVSRAARSLAFELPSTFSSEREEGKPPSQTVPTPRHGYASWADAY